jgi:hypothetical protein
MREVKRERGLEVRAFLLVRRDLRCCWREVMN